MKTSVLSCAWVLLLCCYAHVAHATADKAPLESKQTSRVEELTDSTFFDRVINSTQAWMVMFYAPWCGHCQAAKPEWAEASRTNGEWIGYGAVDCTTQTNLAKRFKVSSYPTVYVFPFGEKTPKSVSKYKSPLKSRAISSHATTLLSSKLISRPHHIPSLQAFLHKRTPTHTKVLVFAMPRDALAIWQALSQHVAAVADVAYISKGNDKLETIFKVYRFPTIIVLRAPSLGASSSYPGIVYRGDLSLTPIKHVITTYHESSQPDGQHQHTYPRNKDIQYHIDATNTKTSKTGNKGNKPSTSRSNRAPSHAKGALFDEPPTTTETVPASDASSHDTELCGLEPTPACTGDGDGHGQETTSTSESSHDDELCGLEPTPACSGDGTEDSTHTDTETTVTPSERSSHDSDELCGLEPTPACSGDTESSDDTLARHDEM